MTCGVILLRNLTERDYFAVWMMRILSTSMQASIVRGGGCCYWSFVMHRQIYRLPALSKLSVISEGTGNGQSSSNSHGLISMNSLVGFVRISSMPHAKARLKPAERLSYGGWADGEDCSKSAPDEDFRKLNYGASSANSGSYKPLLSLVSDRRLQCRDG